MPQLYAFINNGAKKEKGEEKWVGKVGTKSETLISLFHLDLIALNGVK